MLSPKQVGKVFSQTNLAAGTYNLGQLLPSNIENYRAIVLNQDASDVNFQLPEPNDKTAVVSISIVNNGASPVTIEGYGVIEPDQSRVVTWGGLAWASQVSVADTPKKVNYQVKKIHDAIYSDLFSPVTGTKVIITNVEFATSPWSSLSGLANGDIVVYDGTNWSIEKAVSTITESGEVTVYNEETGQILFYDAIVNKWSTGEYDSFFMTAGGSISALKAVRVSDVDGLVYQDGYVTRDSTGTSYYGGSMGNSPITVYSKASNQLVTVFKYDNGTLGYTVGSISNDTTVTWSSLSQISVDVATSHAVAYDETTGKVAIVYNSQTNSNKLAAHILTRSGESWTHSSVSTNLSSGTGINIVTINAKNSNVIVTGYSGSSLVFYKLAYTSGNVVSLASESVSESDVYYSSSNQITDNLIWFIFRNHSTGNVYAKLYTVSSNSLGPEKTIITGYVGGIEYGLGIKVYENTIFFYMSNGNSARYFSYQYDTSSNQIVPAGLITDSYTYQGNTSSNIGISPFMMDNGILELYYDGAGGTNGSYYSIDRSTLTLTLETSMSFGLNSSHICAVEDRNKTIWATCRDFSQAFNKITLLGVTFNDSYSSYPLFGISKENAIGGDKIRVSLDRQISTGHSELTTGVKYYTKNGQISSDATGELIGYALSDTDILVVAIKPDSEKVVSSAIIDNTITDPSTITAVGRYIIPALSTGDFAGKEGQYAEFNGTSFSFSVPDESDTVSIISGLNAGQVWSYKNDEWVMSTQTSELPVSNWILASDYSVNDLVIYNQALYQSNGEILENTPFTIGTTGATWKQIGVSGVAEHVQAVDNSTSNLTLTTSWQNITTLTIPSKGVYNLSGELQVSLTSNQTAAIRITKNGTPISTRVNKYYVFASSASFTNLLDILEQNITCNTGDIIALQAYSAFVTSGGGVVNRDNSTSIPRISAIKVSGFLPVTGITRSYVMAKKSSVQTVTAGDNVIFNLIDGGDIPVDASNGWITLKAGKTYKLQGAGNIENPTTAGYLNCQFYNAATNSYFGTLGAAQSVQTANNFGIQAIATAIISPSTNIQVALRVVSLVNANKINTEGSFLFVEEIGTTATSGSTDYIATITHSGNVNLLGSYTDQVLPFTSYDLTGSSGGAQNWFNTSTYRFTPQLAGWWDITASYDIYRGTSSAEAGIFLRKNGSNISTVDGMGLVIGQTRKIIYLNGTTDYIDVITSGANIQTRQQASTKSFFQAMKIK